MQSQPRAWGPCREHSAEALTQCLVQVGLTVATDHKVTSEPPIPSLGLTVLSSSVFGPAPTQPHSSLWHCNLVPCSRQRPLRP